MTLAPINALKFERQTSGDYFSVPRFHLSDIIQSYFFRHSSYKAGAFIRRLKLMLCGLAVAISCSTSYGAPGDEPQASEETVASEEASKDSAGTAENSSDGSPEKEPADDKTVISSLSEEQYQADPFQLLRQLPDLDKTRSLGVLNHLKLYQREEELVELNDGDDSFYALFLQQRTAAPQGAILIIHDQQQHGHWPHIIAPLREYLPDYGWVTLTIELPAPPAEFSLARSKKDMQKETMDTTEGDGEASSEAEKGNDGDSADGQQTPAQDDQATAENQTPQEDQETQQDEGTEAELTGSEPALPRLDKLPELEKKPDEKMAEAAAPEEKTPIELYQEKVYARLSQALGYLNSRGQYNLAIAGLGQGAQWVNLYLPEHFSKFEEGFNGKGFVLINIDGKASPLLAQPFYQSMLDIETPFLNIITGTKKGDLFHAKRNRGHMKNKKRMKFQQVILGNEFSYQNSESQVNRRIRGWLKTNAGGTELPIN